MNEREEFIKAYRSALALAGRHLWLMASHKQREHALKAIDDTLAIHEPGRSEWSEQTFGAAKKYLCFAVGEQKLRDALEAVGVANDRAVGMARAYVDGYPRAVEDVLRRKSERSRGGDEEE